LYTIFLILLFVWHSFLSALSQLFSLYSFFATKRDCDDGDDEGVDDGDDGFIPDGSKESTGVQKGIELRIEDGCIALLRWNRLRGRLLPISTVV
jgi:hypothetical protein